MLPYIYHALHTFHKVFCRRTIWLTLCLVVLGFLGATQIDGVSSWCRFWGLQPPGYVALLHQDPQISAMRLGHMALDVAGEQGRRCLLVVDAFFSVAKVFQLADSVWSVACKKPLATILVRAKKSPGAYA